jgi:hypothetical protein
MKRAFLVAAIACCVVACKKDDPTPGTPSNTVNEPAPRLIFRFVFDSTMERLNNLGQPAVLPVGHAAQSPRFRYMSAHYVELAPGTQTLLGAGEVLYHAPETTAGGEQAIDFDQSVLVEQGEPFLSLPLSEVQSGTYEWLRVSLAYQNFDIAMRYNGFDLTGTLSSFVGYNTYISDFLILNQSISVNDDKKQGFWAFETTVLGNAYTQTGQAPAGATTVTNPLFTTSPVPEGSCVVTGEFDQPLVITGNETSDVLVTVRLSTNGSFEWVDGNANNVYEPGLGENAVDMGLRGMRAEIH